MARIYGNKKLSGKTDFCESIIVAVVTWAAIDGKFDPATGRGGGGEVQHGHHLLFTVEIG